MTPGVASVYSYLVEDAHLKGQRLKSQQVEVHPHLRHPIAYHFYPVELHKKTCLRSPQCLPQLS